MRTWYLVAAYVHVLTVAVWVGAMLFEDPTSGRAMSRLAYKVRGIGWWSLLVLIATGSFMLHARGVSLDDLVSGRFFSQRYGQVFAAKFALVLLLVGLQVTVGNRPSGALYGYLLSVLVVIALSVWLVRPVV